MIKRDAEKILRKLAKGFPVVAITGPRQAGKTTLAKNVFKEKPYVSLEDPDQREFANDDPKGFLARYPNGAILDEVQRCPFLFSYIQGIVDQKNKQGFFILTGSEQFGLISKITQSLAGRVGLLELLPFSLNELKLTNRSLKTIDEVLLNGFYPPIYDRQISPQIWYANYVSTYIERDVRQILEIKDLSIFQRFIRMVAARTGQLLSLSGLANDCGISHNTAKAWLSVLEASYIIFLLKPYHKNFGKRLVKTPKIYFYDAGIVSWLLGINNVAQISVHPMRGALFENYIVAEIVKEKYNRGEKANLYFWRDNIGNEIDILEEQGNKIVPIEVKSGQTITKNSFDYLLKWQTISGIDSGQSCVVYGGDESFRREGVEIVSWKNLDKLKASLLAR